MLAAGGAAGAGFVDELELPNEKPPGAEAVENGATGFPPPNDNAEGATAAVAEEATDAGAGVEPNRGALEATGDAETAELKDGAPDPNEGAPDPKDGAPAPKDGAPEPKDGAPLEARAPNVGAGEPPNAPKVGAEVAPPNLKPPVAVLGAGMGAGGKVGAPMK